VSSFLRFSSASTASQRDLGPVVVYCKLWPQCHHLLDVAAGDLRKLGYGNPEKLNGLDDIG
jgi:hypothetical protein